MKIYTSLVLLLITSFSFSQKSNLQEANMKGAISSIETTEFIADEKGQKAQKISEMTTLFNKEGNMTELKVWSEYVNHIYKCTYNEKGKIVEMSSFDNANEGKLASTNKSLYNENGQKSEESLLMPDGTLFLRMVFSYDNAGNLIEKKNCGATENSCSEKTIFEYDTSNNLIAEKQMRVLTGKISEKKLYKYDAKGNRIQTEIYNSREELVEKFVYEYDHNNNLVKATPYDAFGIMEGIETYTYVYDNQQNWIKKTKFTDNYPEVITEQKITYYK